MPPHLHAVKARNAKQIEAEDIGIDVAFISAMVENFYTRIRSDEVLSPIFNERITDWPVHLGRMKQFWGSILHKSGGFSGNPMVKHIAIPGIEEAEFTRWLGLLRSTLEEMQVSLHATDLIHTRARMIADSLLMGIRIHRDGKNELGQMKGIGNA